MFNVSAILIYDTLRTTFPLFDDVIMQRSTVVRGSATLQHDRLLQLINGVKLPAVIDSLLYGPQMALFTRFKSDLLGRMSGSMRATLSRRRCATVSCNVRWHHILLQSSLVAPSSVLRFH